MSPRRAAISSLSRTLGSVACAISALVALASRGCGTFCWDRGTLAGMPAPVSLPRHRKRIKNAPESVVWNCSCGFMAWRPRAPKSAIVQLQKAWDRHLIRRTPGNRRQLAVRRLISWEPEGAASPFGRMPGAAAGRYWGQSPFRPRRRLKVSRSIARTCDPEQGDVRHSASTPTFPAPSAGGLSLVARSLVSLHSEETSGLRPPSRKT